MLPQLLGSLLVPFLTAVGVPSMIVHAVAVSMPAFEGLEPEDAVSVYQWPPSVRGDALVALLGTNIDSTTANDRHSKRLVKALMKPGWEARVRKAHARGTILDWLAKGSMNYEHPGEFDRLTNDGHGSNIALGRCLNPLIVERDLCFSHPARDIRKGDVVVFTADGFLKPAVKVFLGEANGLIFFHMLEPSRVIALQYNTVTHMERVASIYRARKGVLDVRDMDLSPFMSSAAREVLAKTDDVPLIAPKAPSLLHGLLTALRGVEEMLRPAG